MTDVPSMFRLLALGDALITSESEIAGYFKNSPTSMLCTVCRKPHFQSYIPMCFVAEIAVEDRADQSYSASLARERHTRQVDAQIRFV
jgi:hypothetical protein